MKAQLLTKEDIARELSDPDDLLSIRSVERYINLAGIKPAVKGSGRGKQAKFRRADIEKIKAAKLAAKRAAAEQKTKQSTALTTTKPAALAPVALVAELISSNAESFQTLRAALDTWPVWLTRSEAIERTGLPGAWFDVGVSKGELAAVGNGRGRRYHREDVRAFAERVRDVNYLNQLLAKQS